MTDDPLARRVEARNRLRDVDFPSSAAMAETDWTDWSTADLIAMTAHDLDAIVVATVGCWSPETRAGVVRTLLEERIVEWQGVAGGMLGMGHGNWEPYRDAIEFAQFILKFDAARLSPLPADATTTETDHG